MKTILFTCLFICAVGSFVKSQTFPASQYYVGIPVNEVIYQGTYSSTTSCLPNYDVSLSINPSILPLASGLDWVLEITGVIVSGGDSIYTLDYGHGKLQVGDTLPYYAANSGIDIYFSGGSGDELEYNLRVMGIPQIDNELYTCKFQIMQGIFNCAGAIQLIADNAPGCRVEDLSAIEELNGNDVKIQFDNSRIMIDLQFHTYQDKIDLNILSIQGRSIYSSAFESGSSFHIPLPSLKSGVYFLDITSDENQRNIARFIIE